VTHIPVVLHRVGLFPLRREVEDVEIEDPRVSDVANLVPKIDGERYHQMFLEARGAADTIQVGIVGGRHNQVAFHIFDGHETHCLRVDDDAEVVGYSVVSSGGSEIDVLTRWLVPRDSAARGLWYILLTG
jgi:hypothetical protein